MTDSSARPGPGEIELKLRGLERLRTAGVVAEAEYERLRAKLLGASAPPPAAPEYTFAPASAAPAPTPTYSFAAPPDEPASPPPTPRYSFGSPEAPKPAWGIRSTEPPQDLAPAS